jgi:hypothetical protein
MSLDGRQSRWSPFGQGRAVARPRRLAVWAVMLVPVSVLGLACGGSAVTLTHDEYARLPADGQQEVFDAENDLVIAKNREDQARDNERLLQAKQDELDQRWKRSEKRLSGSRGSRVPSARKAVDAHRAFIKAQLDVADAAIKVAVVETELSRARLSLVRKRQLVRIGHAAMASLKELEQRVTECEKRVKDARTTDVDLRVKAQNQLGAWKNAEEEHARSTGDFDTGIWID